MTSKADYYDAFWMQNEEMREKGIYYPWTFIVVRDDGSIRHVMRDYRTIAIIANEYDLLVFGRDIKLPKLKQKVVVTPIINPIADYDRAMKGL